MGDHTKSEEERGSQTKLFGGSSVTTRGEPSSTLTSPLTEPGVRERSQILTNMLSGAGNQDPERAAELVRQTMDLPIWLLQQGVWHLRDQRPQEGEPSRPTVAMFRVACADWVAAKKRELLGQEPRGASEKEPDVAVILAWVMEHSPISYAQFTRHMEDARRRRDALAAAPPPEPEPQRAEGPGDGGATVLEPEELAALGGRPTTRAQESAVARWISDQGAYVPKRRGAPLGAIGAGHRPDLAHSLAGQELAWMITRIEGGLDPLGGPGNDGYHRLEDWERWDRAMATHSHVRGSRVGWWADRRAALYRRMVVARGPVSREKGRWHHGGEEGLAVQNAPPWDDAIVRASIRLEAGAPVPATRLIAGQETVYSEVLGGEPTWAAVPAPSDTSGYPLGREVEALSDLGWEEGVIDVTPTERPLPEPPDEGPHSDLPEPPD